MEEDALGDELDIEPEKDDVPYVEYDISVSPSDPTLELLSSQLESGDVVIPFYQRRYVWKIEQASKLIESFIMGLPVPQIFFYVNSENQLEVIDGQQRLKSVKYYFDGYFGEEDANNRRQTFRLRGLAERSEYNGKSFAELAQKDQRKLKNSTLRAINIKQLKPRGNSDAVFHIFQRLNTGGTQLKPQEIRNAIYRGKIVNKLQELNKLESWRIVLGSAIPDKNQRDVELVLRLFSLYEQWQTYEKPMLRYLNQQMNTNRDFDSSRAVRFEENFRRAIDHVKNSLERPFRPKRVLNAAVLEAVMTSVMEDESITSMQLSGGYRKLLERRDFAETITGATTDSAVLKRRIELCKSVLQDG